MEAAEQPKADRVNDEELAAELSGTPGVQSHMPGQDATDKSAAGQVADGTPLDTLGDDELPAENPNSSGDSLADDDREMGTKKADEPGIA